MPNAHPLATILSVGGFVSQPALADDCKRVVVTASVGYTNVRGQPRAASDNLVAAFPTGTVVDVSRP